MACLDPMYAVVLAMIGGWIPLRDTLNRACCEMSRRDGAIVAWHEVPGSAPPQKSRPVGYGLIPAGVRTHSMQLGLATVVATLTWAGGEFFVAQLPE
jgi:hypothetical protein